MSPVPEDEVASIRALLKAIEKQSARLDRIAARSARHEWRELLRGIPNPARLEHFGFKVYSQNDEDGILREVLRRLELGPSSGAFVEIGASNGLENNTHFLLKQQYRGVWIEASDQHIQKMRRLFSTDIAEHRLTVCQSFVTAENIAATVAGALEGQPVTLLSIDVDGNDYWIWKALTNRPPVVVIEFNGKFPPPLSVVQEYRPDHVWRGTDYFGASLAALTTLGSEKGYELVGCNITGSNAFFVRQDLVADRFPYDRTAESLYQPCRYDLTHDCFANVGYKADVGPFMSV